MILILEIYGNFMAISRLLSNYDATLKELLLKPKGEINYLSPTIQNKLLVCLVPPLGTILSQKSSISDNNSGYKTCPKLTNYLYISVTENDDNVPKEIKNLAAGLKTVILNLTKEYGIDLTKCRGQG
nr:unnamed protein product [Callosobruchus analis]